MSISIPRPTAIASTLLWFAGALLLLLTLSLVIFATSSKAPSGASLVPQAMFLWTLTYGIGGFAMRKQKWGYRWWAIGLCASSGVAAYLLLSPMTLIILVLNVVALALIVPGWRNPQKG